MKNLILISAVSCQLLISCFSSKAQEVSTNPNAPVITFQKDTIDYGTIPHNSDGYRSFLFTNTGKEPLIINDAHGSCTCTIPTFPKEPIQAGKSSEMKVHYNTDHIGQFIKTVTIKSNATNSPKVVYIKGNVLPDDAVSTNKVNAPASTAAVNK